MSLIVSQADDGVRSEWRCLSRALVTKRQYIARATHEVRFGAPGWNRTSDPQLRSSVQDSAVSEVQSLRSVECGKIDRNHTA